MEKRNRISPVKSFTVKPETAKRFEDYTRKNNINKSSLIDRLINEEIDKKENKK